MELRKIQRTSGGTFFVCLPKDWAEKNGLKRGSTVSVFEAPDGRLIIDPKYDFETPLQTVVIKPSPFLERQIIGNYLLGYDIIEVESKGRISLADRELVKNVSSRLIGLEIVEENYSKIVLQSLLEPSSFPPEKILKREYSIASGMHRDAVTALIEGNPQSARNVIARDDEVDRLYFLLVRTLRKVIRYPRLGEKLGIKPIECLDYRLAASFIEDIGDRSVQIAESVIKLGEIGLPKDLVENLLRFHKIVYESHEDALKALFTHNDTLAESVRNKNKEVSKIFHEIEALAHSKPENIASTILTVAPSINQIYERSVDIADLVMPKALLKQNS